MADDKDMTPEEAAKKSREEAVKAQDNPPEPYPSQEELDKIKSGEPIDDEEDEGTPATKRPAPQPAPSANKAMEAGKPAGGYQSR